MNGKVNADIGELETRPEERSESARKTVAALGEYHYAMRSARRLWAERDAALGMARELIGNLLNPPIQYEFVRDAEGLLPIASAITAAGKAEAEALHALAVAEAAAPAAGEQPPATLVQNEPLEVVEPAPPGERTEPGKEPREAEAATTVATDGARNLDEGN